MTERTTGMTDAPAKRCDTKIWCGECERGDYRVVGEKFLCVTCGKILHLDHEVHHEVFPHVSGDPDTLI